MTQAYATCSQRMTLNTYGAADDGTLQQRVRSDAELTLRVRRTSRDRLAETKAEVAAVDLGRAFDVERDLPLRITVLVTDDGPAEVILVVSHMSVDTESLRLVVSELARLLSAEPPPPSGWQPVDQAKYENSADARRVEARNLAYWESAAAAADPVFLSPLPGAEPVARQWAQLESEALALAVVTIGRRSRANPRSVLLAAISLGLAAVTGAPNVAMRLLTSVRFRPESVGLVGAVNLNALMVLPVGGGSWESLLRRTTHASLVAYRHCEAHPHRIEEAVRRAAVSRGGHAGSFCFVNDVAEPYRQNESVDGDLAPVLATAAIRTVAEALDLDDSQYQSKFFLFIQALGPRTRLRLSLDPRFLGANGAVGFLTALEDTLVRVALNGDPDLDDLIRVFLAARR